MYFFISLAILVYSAGPAVAQTVPVSLFPNARRDFLVQGGQPNRLTVRDLDGDQKPDLIASCGSINPLTARLFKGIGNGTFQDLGPLSLTGSVLVADFNNDSKPDLVSTQAAVALGNGDGTFQPPNITPLSGAECAVSSNNIDAGDFNKDGKLDVAIAAEDSIHVLLGNGNGTLQTPVPYVLEANPVAVAAGDLNQDGNLDLVAAGRTTFNRLYVLLGSGNGTFQTPTFRDTCGLNDITVSDLNRDGRVDVAGVCPGFVNSLQVFIGAGNGTFAPVQAFNPLNVNPWSVAAADVNGDLSPDLIVVGGDANTQYGSASVLIGTGTGTFPSAVSYALPGNTLPQGLAIADLDVNGALDMAVGNRTGRPIGGFFSVFRGVGNGSFLEGPRLSGIDNAQSLITADFNQDTNPDMAVANFGSNQVSIFLGTGTSTFLPAVHYAVGTSPSAVASGDFNKDGKLDLAVTNQNSDSISILGGTGLGTFQSVANIPLTAQFRPSSISAGDFNNDGNSDLAVEGAGFVSVLRGNGDHTFQAVANYNGLNDASSVYVARFLNSLTTGDFNQDGMLDFAALSYGLLDGVTIFLGNGDFTFRSDLRYLLPNRPSYITCADFNKDGKLDLATVSLGQDSLSVLLGIGNGHFENRVDYEPGHMPVNIAVGDLNNDGNIDIATANLYSENISVRYGNGTGAFGTAHFYGTAGALAIAIGDWNKDGTKDLAAAGQQWGMILVGSVPPQRRVRGQLISN